MWWRQKQFLVIDKTKIVQLYMFFSYIYPRISKRRKTALLMKVTYNFMGSYKQNWCRTHIGHIYTGSNSLTLETILHMSPPPSNISFYLGNCYDFNPSKGMVKRKTLGLHMAM